MYVVARYAPAGSALAAALVPAAAWGTETHALATVIDQLKALVWLTAGAQGPQPEPIPRPGVSPEDDVTEDVDRDLEPVTMEELDEWYRQQFLPRDGGPDTVRSGVTEEE